MLHASILIIRVHIHTLSWKRLVTFWMFRISAHFTGLTRLAMSVQHVKKEKLSHPILHSSLFNGPFTGPLFIFVLFKQFDRIKQTCTKTQKLVQVLWNGPFPDQGPGGGAHGAGSPIQQYNFFAEQTMKISVYFMQRIKSYSIFTARQTHRQTDRCTFCIPICTGEIFFYMEIYTFHYTTFLCSLRSLTHFICKG